MDLDRLARSLASVGSRRRLLGGVSAVPALGGFLAMVGSPETEAKDRRRRRKQRHKKRKNPGGRKKGCTPGSRAKVCAGKCGPVKNRKTCGKVMDCGACDCTPACGECFTCQGAAGAPGICVPDAQGTPCGPAPTCDGSTLHPQGACDASHVCQPFAPMSCPTGVCWDGACVCGDVCASGCQFTSVQAAIDSLPSGSTIRICAGAYAGQVTITGDVTLAGAGDGDDPEQNTILDADLAGSVVTVFGGVTATLQGLRLTGGSTGSGAGVLNSGNLTMTNCTVTGNAATSTGAGIHSQGPSLTMTNCAVTYNTGQSYGGGIFSTGPVLTMTDCDISDNQTTLHAAGLHLEQGQATLTRCIVTRNRATGIAGGILSAQGQLTLDDCHVTDNEASSDGGVRIRSDLGATITIEGDTTICGNDAPQCNGFSSSACQDTCP